MRASAHTLVVLAFYWLGTIVVVAAIIVPVLFARCLANAPAPRPQTPSRHRA